ncbi:hypothetical protein ACFVKH_01035 [Almyronema epifaneia S1]|uniref:Uncharacterized protein n=1 Tax=Almyronema epifaneia S1 TaxID=2991925 RepID=A0ABW6I9J4_9CYAN
MAQTSSKRLRSKKLSCQTVNTAAVETSEVAAQAPVQRQTHRRLVAAFAVSIAVV